MKQYKYYNLYLERAKKLKAVINKLKSVEEKGLGLKRYYEIHPIDLIYSKQLWIISQEAEFIKLDPTLRPAQMEILELVQEYIELDKPLFLAIPKSRRQGVSTIVEAIIFCLCSQTPNKHAIVIADDITNSANIFEMTKMFYKNLNNIVKPTEDKNNFKELKFESNRSLMRIDTANKVNIGQSWAFQYVHLSEVALFPNAESIMTSLVPTMSRKNFVFLVLESTGRGVGGYYYDTIMAALSKENDFTVHFLPFFKHPDHKMKIPEGLKIEWYKDHVSYGNELYIMKYLEEHGADNIPERMYWRRDTIRNVSRNSLKIFKQEYPMSIMESFQSGGVEAFDIEGVNFIELDTKPPYWRGILKEKGGRVVFEENDNGWFYLWELPDYEWKYLYNTALDTGGKWGESEKIGSDWNFATVRNRVKKSLAAMFRIRAAAHIVAYRILLVGRYFDNSQIVIEINKWNNEVDANGEPIVNYLKENYSNLYYHKVQGQDIDKQTKKIGFFTTKGLKRDIINIWDRYILDYKHTGEHLNSQIIAKELKQYEIKEKEGVYGAIEGERDDGVMSYGINLLTSAEMPVPEPKRKDEYNYEEMIEGDPMDALR